MTVFMGSRIDAGNMCPLLLRGSPVPRISISPRWTALNPEVAFERKYLQRILSVGHLLQTRQRKF